MLGGDVVFLARVCEHVEELFVNEAVLVVADGEVLPLVRVWFGSGRPAGLVCEEVAVGPG